MIDDIKINFNSNSNVFVHAPHFDDLTHRVKESDDLAWWSPNLVLTTILYHLHNVLFGVCYVYSQPALTI